MPKSEIRRKLEIRNPNWEPPLRAASPPQEAPFGLRISDFLRISDLGFRNWHRTVSELGAAPEGSKPSARSSFRTSDFGFPSDFGSRISELARPGLALR